jgi:Undecaprenyl-phosphate glucose phosphotransferase
MTAPERAMMERALERGDFVPPRDDPAGTNIASAGGEASTPRPDSARLSEAPDASTSAMTDVGQFEREGRYARQRTALAWRCFGPGLAALEFAVVVATSVLVGIVYHLAAYGSVGEIESFASLGALVALIFVTIEALHRHYRVPAFIAPARNVKRPVATWTIAILYALAIGFLMKTGGELSRGSVVLLSALGLLPLLLERALVVKTIGLAAKTGGITARRVLLIGPREAIDRFALRYQPWNVGFQIVGQAILRSDGATDAELDQAVHLGRVLEPDDIFVLMPWHASGAIERIADALLALPASIHLGPEQILDRFNEAHIVKIATMTTMCLLRPPLTRFDVAMKRGFDLVVGSIATVALAPMMLAIALAIRLDSKGPILFRQHRYGFNQKPFAIFKFRTMAVEATASGFRQAHPHDPRVTRVGRILRRWNLDELPQLFNVLRGDMALVGPRPHAVPHNQEFERRINLYARRHNVKPGITGWAQVNGLRGATDTEEKMRRRVEYDLYYLDNWSFAFDLRIIGLTLLSRRAYANAY